MKEQTFDKIVAYCNDFGRYLLDASKVVLGVAVVSPIFQKGFSFSIEDFYIDNTLLVGIIVSLITAIAGIYLKNKK